MTISVARNDPPAASFYMKKQPWVLKAACVGSDLDVFFDHIDYAKEEAKTLAIRQAQEICKHCDVRVECGADIMEAEADASEGGRYGFRAYMTPEQRTSVHRRGGLKGRDPMRLVRGWDGKRAIPAVPEEGDKWSKHHTALARKVVRWMVDNVEIGEKLPTMNALAAELHCSHGQLRRVMDALVQDGTLDNGPKARYRNGATAAYVRLSTPRLIAWLPPHLRTPT